MYNTGELSCNWMGTNGLKVTALLNLPNVGCPGQNNFFFRSCLLGMDFNIVWGCWDKNWLTLFLWVEITVDLQILFVHVYSKITVARIEGPLKNDIPFNLSPESETYVFYSRDDRTYFVLGGGGGGG